MRTSQVRTILATIWTASFIAAIVALLFMRWIIGIENDTFKDTVEYITVQYVPYVGAVLGFYFATRPDSGPALAAKPSHVLAVVSSGLWNLVTLGFLLRACLEVSSIDDSVRDLSGILPKLAFFVSPAMGLFFGNAASSGDKGGSQ